MVVVKQLSTYMMKAGVDYAICKRNITHYPTFKIDVH